MKRTLIISLGNQYDADGYSIVDGRFGYAWGSRAGLRMDGTKGITRDGNLVIPADDNARVEDAILATLADGIERRVVVGEDAARVALAVTPQAQPCDKCGTWCQGECEGGENEG